MDHSERHSLSLEARKCMRHVRNRDPPYGPILALDCFMEQFVVMHERVAAYYRFVEGVPTSVIAMEIIFGPEAAESSTFENPPIKP